MLSMNAETARGRHPSNYTLIEEDRLAILRSAAILGANASGKSNMLLAFGALRWMIVESGDRKDGQHLPTYEPFKLDADGDAKPTSMEIEFVVGSGIRYRYEISFTKHRVIEERLFSFARRSKALLFERNESDTWETIKFGGSYKGGTRRFPFFDNAAYLSRAGNDASSPEQIREIYRYFQRLVYVPAGNRLFSSHALSDKSVLNTVSDIICLADTGVSRVTVERREVDDLRLPEDMPDEIKEAILEQNRMSAKFWVESESGKLVSFEKDDMSDGTVRLLEILPPILNCLSNGTCLLFDEIGAHFHSDLIELILRLFHDDEINSKGSQLIYTTHDTNILNSSNLRRDQVWFVSKSRGSSTVRCLDEYDKKIVRPDSPFEAFYRDGRLGALPRVSFDKVKQAIVGALAKLDTESEGAPNA